MECRVSLVHAYLVSPGLDPDEVGYGQLLTVLTAMSVLLVSHLLMLLAQTSSKRSAPDDGNRRASGWSIS